jgi:hypothetical protein
MRTARPPQRAIHPTGGRMTIAFNVHREQIGSHPADPAHKLPVWLI